MPRKISFFVISSWFSMTLVLDFLVVPLMFRNISNFFEAGKFAIKLFSFYNVIEIVLSLALLLTLFKRGNLKKYILAGLLFGITLFYHFFLIPQITEWATLWEAHTPTSSFYHQLYRYVDLLKIIILAYFLFLSSKDKKSFNFSDR